MVVYNQQNQRDICPLIEEFHIKNVIAGVERKQWVIGGRVTMGVVGPPFTYALTFLSLSGGVIQNLTSYRVLAQKLNAQPSEETYVVSKNSYGVTLAGDSGSVNSVIILGTEPTGKPPDSQKKWAKDYCPYCKARGINAILGSSVKDEILFGFHATTGGGGTYAVKFGTVSKYINLFALPAGSLDNPLFTSMADATYQISITKAKVAAGVVPTIPPWASSINREGFTLNGDANSEYDVYILGQILY